MNNQVIFFGVRATAFALTFALGACGGGGGESGNNPAPNQAPIAHAGPDRSVDEGASVQLDGSTSTDPNGAVAQYEWSQTAGPTVTLANANTAVASFTAPATNATLTLTFRLTVTDEPGATDADDVTITIQAVNHPPVAANDTAATNEDTAVVVDVLANDTDADDADSTSDPAQIDPATVAVSAVQNGTATVDAATGRVTFAPAANFNGSGSFKYTVRDITGAASNAATATISVAAVDDAPVISPIANQATDEDTSTGVAFTVGDIDNDPNTLTVTATSSNPALVPASGLAPGGSGTNRTLTITPTANQSGTANITVSVSDGPSGATSAFTLTVNAVNDAPVAQNDAAATPEDTAVTVNVLANDSDADSSLDPASVAIANVANGTAVADSAGRITFTPTANFNGPASFTYQVRDADGAASNVATVGIDVTSVNDLPVATAGSASTDEDTAVNGTLQASDVEPGTLTYAVTTAPQHGTATVAGATFTYTPAADYNGSDAFAFKACDGDGGCSDATQVSLTVNAINDAPAIGAIADQATDEDTPTGAIAFTVSDAEGNASSLTVTAQSDNATLLPQDGMTLGGSAGDRTITLSPAADGSGTARVTITVSDGTDTATRTFALTVNPVNDAPTISTLADRAIDEDGSTGSIAFTIGDVDNNVDVAPVSATSDNAGLVPDAALVLGGSGADRTLSITPAANGNGVAHITVTVGDGSKTADSKFVLTVNAVNDAPVIGAIADQSIGEDQVAGPTHFTISDVDSDVAQLAVTATSANTSLLPDSNIALGGSGGDRTLTLTPVANHSGSAAITVTVSDGSASAATTTNLVVAGVNDAPTISQIADQTTTEDTPTGAIAFTISDADGDALTVTATSSDGTLVPASGITLGGSGADRTVTLAPAADAHGTARITITVADASAQASSAFALAVTSVNDSPQAFDDGAITDEDTLAVIDVLHNDVDNDSALDPASVAIKSESHGVAMVNSTTGAVSFLPDANFYGDAAFTYTVKDAEGAESRAATVAVTVNPVNDVPVVADAHINGVEDTTTANQVAASDADGEALTFTTLSGPSHGTLAIAADGSFTYRPQLNYAGPDEFKVSTSDGHVDSAPATIAITVADQPEARLAVTDASSREGGSGLGFTVTLSRSPDSPVTVHYATADGTAKNGSDYSGVDGELAFDVGGPLSQTVAVAVADDSEDERDETLGVALRVTAGNASVDAADTAAAGTIEDNDGIDQATAECELQELPGFVCELVNTVADLAEGTLPGAGNTDPTLVAAAAEAQALGCDMLDPAECLFPFPNDHFTVPAANGSPQGTDPDALGRRGTGKRINFTPLAMPRNAAGKPIDPAEWNRNDGYSPGQLIVTYVPHIGTVKDEAGKPLGPIKGAVPITDLPRYLDDDAPILVLDAETGQRHPIYAEIDLNAGYLLPMQGLGPKPAQLTKPALLIRPATNFTEGHRYVVVLRNLKDDADQAIAAQAAFAACRDANSLFSLVPPLPAPLQSRCQELEDTVFPVLDAAGIDRDDSLYLAWDFTVASGRNDVARLVAMRDDAFKNYLEDTTLSAPGESGYPGGRAPSYVVTKVTENPDGPTGKTVRRIQGTFTVPSYVVPADPSRFDADVAFHEAVKRFDKEYDGSAGIVMEKLRKQCYAQEVPDEMKDGRDAFCSQFDAHRGDIDENVATAASLSLPPNRLNYLPDASSAAVCDPDAAQAAGGCATQARYGDGLPDRNRTGDLTANFTCNIPRSAISNKASMNVAAPEDVKPVRPTLYGHGLLGGQGEGNGQASDFGNVYGLMTCAADWFGFASGDIGNVASALVDLSNFAAVPDGAQQGVLNQLFLARLAVHPDGFAADTRFQVRGKPVFDRREVFYNGNSQGGIMGGVVVAASKDVNRGVLGVLGMNYSTLLARSTDFALYSVPLYLSYTDDLERPFAMSLMQMLWDRAENDGYAEHLTDNTAMGGPNNAVLLQPAIGDHQVTMWSAEVMARTVGAKLDRHRVRPERHPDVDASEYFGLTPIDYAGGEHWSGSALVPYDQLFDPATGTEHWNSQNDTRCDYRKNRNGSFRDWEFNTAPPPAGNRPPNRTSLEAQAGDETGAYEPEDAPSPPVGEDASVFFDSGEDPHECPRRDPQARCQMSHFLLRTPYAGSADTAPELVDVANIAVFGASADTDAGCPAVVITGAPDTGGTSQPAELDPAMACIADPAGPGCPLNPVLAPIDQQLDTLPPQCRKPGGQSNPGDAGCFVFDATANVLENDNLIGAADASCVKQSHLTEKRSYHVVIPSESGQRISFQVLEPTAGTGIDCTGKHPLILQGHGFGGSRTTVRNNSDGSLNQIGQFNDAGYAVISIDQRGFGDSTGTVRVMDPDYEGKDLVAILDWAESNLDYLAYQDNNLLAGSIGGSYGGGYQFLLQNVDPENRLDAMAPDITWHDLRYSLNPGDTLKSAFGLLLTAGGERGSYQPGFVDHDAPADRGIDPYIKEVLARAVATGEFPREALAWFKYHSPSYWCGLNGEPQMPYGAAANEIAGTVGALRGDLPGSNKRRGQAPVDILLSQGFRDNLFNFNDAWWNYQCARVRGGDVRMLTHQAGHILDPRSLVSSAVPRGTPLDVQTPPTTNNCGAIDRPKATLQWFDQKLKGATEAQLVPTDDRKLCLSLSDNDAIYVPEQNVLAPRAAEFAGVSAAPTVSYTVADAVTLANVPHGAAAQAQFAAAQDVGRAADYYASQPGTLPSRIENKDPNLQSQVREIATPAPLLTVTANEAIVAGIAQGDITISSPAGANEAGCANSANVPTTRTGCDATIFVGLGVKKANTEDWILIDDQITPVRGLGKHLAVAFAGVGERLAEGDELGLMVYGYHRQYLGSYSRDATLPAVNVTAKLSLPLYAVGSDGKPDFTVPAADSVRPIEPTPAEPGLADQVADGLQEFLTRLGAGDIPGAVQSLQDTGGLVVAAVGDALGLEDGSGPDGIWLAGDMHVHDDHSADGSGMRQTTGQGAPGNVSVKDQIDFAQSQGLDFLPLTDHRTFDQHYDPLWTSNALLLITGEEANGSPHANVFGAVDMINQADNPAGTPEFRRLQQSIWDAHAQGAAWSTNHPDDGEVITYPKKDADDHKNPEGGHPVLDANGMVTPNSNAFATGPDLIEIWNRGTLNGPKIAYAENRWNAGWRTGIAGASDNHFKELWAAAGPGAPTTHVLAAEKSTTALLDALKAGRTVINRNAAAPFVTLEGDFDGDGKFETVGGDERHLDAGKNVTLRVSVKNGIGATVSVWRMPGKYQPNAKPFREFKPRAPAEAFTFRITADAGHPQDWYRVEVRGPGDPDAADYQEPERCSDALAFPPDTAQCHPQTSVEGSPADALRAITAPIFVSTGAFASPDSPELPADAGAEDGAIELFGSAQDNAFAGFADVAVAGGTVHAVAEVRAAHASHVQYRARRADGSLGEPVDLSPDSRLARQPAIAASGQDVWVAFEDDRGNEMPHNPQIVVRHSTDGGASWGEPQRLTHGAGRSLRPDIAILPTGNPVVVWENNDSDNFDIYAQVLGIDGAPAKLTEDTVNRAGQPYDSRSAIHVASVSAKVAVSRDGEIAVGWQTNRFDEDPGWTGHMASEFDIQTKQVPDCQAEFQRAFNEFDPPDPGECGFPGVGTQTDDWEIMISRRAPGGDWLDAVISLDDQRADRHVALAYDATGSLHIAWDSKDLRSMAGPRLEIRERMLGYGTTDGITRVTHDTQSSSQRPAYAANGDALSLMWTDGRSADWRWRVMRTDAGVPETEDGAPAVKASDANATVVTGRGNGQWPSYDHGVLVFTSDRNATREQRKPQQVFITTLDAPAAEVAAGPYSPIADADQDGVPDSQDQCLYVKGSPYHDGCPNPSREVCVMGELVCWKPSSEIADAIDSVKYALHLATPVTPLPAQGVFLVGTGRADQNPREKVCFGSGTFCSHSADPTTEPNAIRDDLYARATAITGKNDETLIVVATTNIGYFLAYKPEQSGFNGIYDVRLRIAQATGVPSTNIVVVSDHSHNGPDTIGIWGGVSANYMKLTADAVVSAAVQAWESRRSAVIRVAAVNQNGNLVPGVTSIVSSAYSQAPANDQARGNPYNEFRLLVADDATTGERILTLANYAPHATISNGDKFDGKYRLTGDWASWMPQEAEAIYGGMGMGTIATVGGTDWNPDEVDRNHDGTDIDDKEREARARLRTLMAAATQKLSAVRGAGVQVESTFVREPIMEPALPVLNAKPGIDRNGMGGTPVTDATNGMDLRIDRSVLPPFLTGDVLGTYVSAARIGDVFFSMFPGEPFGELDHAMQDEGRVQGARVQFLLGGANDFFGYMVKNLDTYQHITQSSALWLSGACPDRYVPGAPTRPAGENGCADHWTLMVSPAFGSHIVCTLQDAADRLGFKTANRDAECPVLTALDGLAPPPESDSPVAQGSMAARQAAVDQARALAEQCRATAAPGATCDALAEGAKQAQTYLGTGDESPDGGTDGSVIDKLTTAVDNLTANISATLEDLAARGSAFVAGLTGSPATAPEQLQAAAGEAMNQVGVIRMGNPWMRRPPLNISHRGGENDWPENTMFAYAESIRAAGSDMIEMDIYETADGELVVIHDDTVDRTTNGTGSVSSHTLSELKALDAGFWFAQESSDKRHGTDHNRPASEYVYRGIATGAKELPEDVAALGYTANDFRIPTLREIFENPHFADVKINIELKPDPDSTGQYEAKLARMVRDYGRGEDVIVASFLDHNSTLFKLNAPEIGTSVPTVQVAAAKATGNPPFAPDGTNSGNGITLGHVAFQVPVDFSGIPVITPEFVTDAHARGLAVQAWTINDEAQMKELLGWCVDGIMSDKPLLLEKVLQDHQWSCPLDGPVEPPPAATSAPKPSVADVCAAYGEDTASPLCGQLRSAEQQLQDSCASGPWPSSLCTLTGGNLHALIDACYDGSGGNAEERRDGQQLAVCRVADEFVTGVAAYCRQVANQAPDALHGQVCALIGGQQVGEYQMQAYERSWIHKALRLQNRLGYDLANIHTSVVATHNSFNATDDNTPPTVSGSDSNQLYDIKDQLRMGVRTIEIDIHWVPSLSPSRTDQAGADTQLREPVVCHGLDDSQMHGGCLNEKPLAEVLREIRTWLDANPNEALFIYVEDHLSGPGTAAGVPFDAAAGRFREVMGDLIFTPGDTHPGSTCESSGGSYGTTGSWLNVKRADIIGARKQVVLFADGYNGGCSPGGASPAWDTLVHKKTDENVLQGGGHAGAAYPSSCPYDDRAMYQSRWTRVWDDSTVVAATDAEDMTRGNPPDATDNEGPITPAIARELMRCGMQMPGLDQLAPFDGRLEAMVWSWAPNEPSDAAGKDCAYLNANGRLVADSCDAPRPYACVGATPDSWSVSTAVGAGDAPACDSGTFSVPANGYYNELLKAHAAGREVWVNYHRDAAAFEGWASDHDASGAGTPRTGGTAEAGIDYGTGLIGALAQLMSDLHDVLTALLTGDFSGAGDALAVAVAHLGDNLGGDPGSDPGAIAGLDQSPDAAAQRALSAERNAETVVLAGARLAGWSVPPAQGVPYPYPSGSGIRGQCNGAFGEENCDAFFGPVAGAVPGADGTETRSAHNGQMTYPVQGSPMGVAVGTIAAYRWNADAARFEEIPVQVDQRFPYFLANAASDFGIYSGTDEELTYEWDVERWGSADPQDPAARYSGATRDPVSGLDDDDEIAFMAKDAGPQAPVGSIPPGATAVLEVALADPLPANAADGDPLPRFVYLAQQPSGPTIRGAHYVQYARHADADQWIDQYFFAPNSPNAAGLDPDPSRLGTSNTGYGPNRHGKVEQDGVRRDSEDRFPRDGVTVTTDKYRWEASGRWMVRDVRVAQPDADGVYGPDLVDRWKGRAFQQSPDSAISLVGFEDEQVNWEANSTLLGERCGPVRCMREVWGADSGTNVTKTETFYRDAIAYRYHVRVHPIPPDGLYTSWDYNRGAMLPAAGEKTAAGEPALPGRYFTALRPQGVPVDGVNDDIGQTDAVPYCKQFYENAPPALIAGMNAFLDAFNQGTDSVPFVGLPSGDEIARCAAYFDAADPTFNLPVAFDNWEQVSGKGDSGSLVYTFEIKGATSVGNPMVVPYYRDDACLDDGTGDDPVPRQFPGEAYAWNNGAVPHAYDVLANRALDHSGKTRADCAQRQGAYASHGLHFFLTHDSDNAFVVGKPSDEIDGQQWQFMVPTRQPVNVGERYANIVRAPLVATVTPRSAGTGPADDGLRDPSFEGRPGDGFYGSSGAGYDGKLVTELARTGGHAIDLGIAGRDPDQGHALVLTRVLSFARPNLPLAGVTGFSYWYQVPNDPGRDDAHLHHYLFVDLDGDGAWDGCLYASPADAIDAVQTTGWQQAVHDSRSKYVDGRCTAQRNDTFEQIPDAGWTLNQVKTNFGRRHPGAAVTQTMLRLYTSGAEAWPAGAPVYVDDLSLQFAGPSGPLPVDTPPEQQDPVIVALWAVDDIVAAISGDTPADTPRTAANGAAAVVAAAYSQSPTAPTIPGGGIRMASDCSSQSWIGGTTEICNGVLTYRDYVYDDHGADTQAMYNSGYGANAATLTGSGSPGGPLSPYQGDDTYPSNQLNTADLVKLELHRNGGNVDVVAELNTLYDTSTTKLAIAVDTDDDAQTTGVQLLGLTVAGADVAHEFTERDALANTIIGSFPLPAAAHWKVWAVVAQGDGLPVMNVAFRSTAEEAKGLTSQGALSGTWWEDKQATALAAKDISGFGYRVATADLQPGVDKFDSILPGLHERIYVSQYTLAPGEGISAGGVPGRDGKKNYPCEQLFHFLGKYQPYGIYIPHAYTGGGDSGMQLVLHGCSANHASLINAVGMQSRFGEELNRVLVVPLGRGPNGFNSDIAERDVLDVMDDVELNYEIDRDQVFSGGYSMGGFGAMRFAALYPDRFAGAANWVGFTGNVFNAPVLGTTLAALTDGHTPSFQGYDNSSTGADANMLDFIRNLNHVPMVSLYSGADELVNANTGLALMKAFHDATDVPYRFFFHPAADHLTYALADDWQKEAKYLHGLKRVVNPARVTYRTTNTLDYNEAPRNYGITHDKAYWISGIKAQNKSGYPGAVLYSDVDLTSSGCANASVPVFTQTPDAHNMPSGADPVPWVAEYRKQIGTIPLTQPKTLMGTLNNVERLTIDVNGACLDNTATFCIETNAVPVTLNFSDNREPVVITESCPQPRSTGLPVTPPEPPSSDEPITVGPVVIDPKNHCGSMFGFGGCLPF